MVYFLSILIRQCSFSILKKDEHDHFVLNNIAYTAKKCVYLFHIWSYLMLKYMSCCLYNYLIVLLLLASNKRLILPRRYGPCSKFWSWKEQGKEWEWQNIVLINQLLRFFTNRQKQWLFDFLKKYPCIIYVTSCLYVNFKSWHSVSKFRQVCH